MAKIKELIAAIGRISNATNRLKPVFDALDNAALNIAATHSGRLSAWINTSIGQGNKFRLAFGDISRFNAAAGHGHIPSVLPNAVPNAVTSVTNPSHIGLDHDPSRDDDGRPIVDLDL